MRNMKDLILFSILLCFILFIYQYDKNITIYTLTILSTVLFYKISCIKIQNQDVNQRYKTIFKDLLQTQKKYFSMILTHDLKIPTLAQLRGLQILKNTNSNLNPEQREVISQLEYSCKYVLEMIAMIINTYEFESKKQKLVYETFNMSDLIIKCIEEMSERIMEKNLTLTYSQMTNDTNVQADKIEIKKVIKNLLNSAINHSFSGSNLNISIYANKKHLKFTISGMQLDFDNTNNIFKKSNHIVPEYTTIGQNIGMYLSKKIVEFHNGKIYSSRDTNVNNKLTFEIPRYSRNSAICSSM